MTITMNKKVLTYSLVTLLTSTTIAAFSIIDRAKANDPNQIKPSNPSNRSPMRGGMNMRADVDKSFIEMMIPHHQSGIEMAQMASSRAKSPEIKKLAQSIISDQTLEIQQMQTWYKQWYGKEVPKNTMNMGRGMNTTGANMSRSIDTGTGMRMNTTGANMSRSMDMGAGMGINTTGANMSRSIDTGAGRGMNTTGANMSRSMDMGAGMGMNMNEAMKNSMQQHHMEMMTGLQNAPDFDQEFLRQMTHHHRMATMMSGMVVNSARHTEVSNLAQSIVKSQSNEIAQMQRLLQAMNTQDRNTPTRTIR